MINVTNLAYLEGLTIPETSVSILTVFFFEGKSLKEPRIPYSYQEEIH